MNEFIDENIMPPAPCPVAPPLPTPKTKRLHHAIIDLCDLESALLGLRNNITGDIRPAPPAIPNTGGEEPEPSLAEILENAHLHMADARQKCDEIIQEIHDLLF